MSQGRLGQADPDAVLHALNKGGGRITQINEYTRKELKRLVGRAIHDGLSPREAGDLIEQWSGFDEYRAERIARTEMMNAYNQAALSSYRGYGVALVVAVDGDKDEQCAERDGKVFSILDAEGIQDHPNGTLDWLPVAPDEGMRIEGSQSAAPREPDVYVPAKSTGQINALDIKRAAERRTKTYQQAGEAHGDSQLHALYKKQGFDGPTQIVSQAELDAYVARGEVELYRGMHRGAEAYRTGEYYPGFGIYGNGTYTATAGDLMAVSGGQARIGQVVARQYAGANGEMIRMTLRADARTITYNEARAGAQRAVTRIQGEIDEAYMGFERYKGAVRADARFQYSNLSKLPEDEANALVREKDALIDEARERVALRVEELESESEVLRDPGRWATFEGYDAIDVSASGDPYWVILNRTATRTQRNNWEWTTS